MRGVQTSLSKELLARTDPWGQAWRAGPGVVAALTFLGIATGFGITTAVGCVLEAPWSLGDAPFAFASAWSHLPLNVLLSAGMLALACTSVVISRPLALILMAIEFVGFLLYLFFLKGGYAVGFAGTPTRGVLQYDALSVAVRISVLGLLGSGQSPNRRQVFKVALLGFGLALVIVGVKAALFRLPILR
jgi:hypothetical protein